MTNLTPSGLPAPLVRAALSEAVAGIERALEGQAIGECAIVAVLLNPVGDGSMDVQVAGWGDPDHEATLALSLLHRAHRAARKRGCALAPIYAEALAALERAAQPRPLVQ